MANRLHGHEGSIHVVGYVVSGIGFLGAGVIMREQGSVRGLNTAATLWGSAAIGACAGVDLLLEAVLATGFVLAANTLLRPIVHAINREPLDTASCRGDYHRVCNRPSGASEGSAGLARRRARAQQPPDT